MTIDKCIQILLGDRNDDEIEGFLRFISDKLWNLYNQYIMDKIIVADNEANWNLNVKNAKENQLYNCTVYMPQLTSDVLKGVSIILDSVTGLDQEKQGLLLTISPDKKSFSITGTPSLDYYRQDGATAESTFEIVIKYRFEGVEMHLDNPSSLERRIPFVINQDPRKLWKNLPVDWDNMSEPKYKNEDTQSEYVKVSALADGTPQKDIVAASKRGRSHAQEGKPRDDHFMLKYMDNGWYIMAVADGAGSALYSREGSRIACKESVNHCIVELTSSRNFEKAIEDYNAFKNEGESNARKTVGDYIYKIVGGAAFKAHKQIEAEAAIAKKPTKLYATTLLLTICKHFSFGWFLASFWVGDGAICLYDRKAHTAKILGIPDEGEYAGQTRFLTMPDIFNDIKSLYKRLRFNIVDDFTALFLMTDGVSDPKFETDANLNNPDKWDDLWNDFKENGVELKDDNEESKNQLLNWLDFWAPGNHDDRTIAILYEGEDDDQVDTELEIGSDRIEDDSQIGSDGSFAELDDMKQENVDTFSTSTEVTSIEFNESQNN
jgi:serine/threonine protein phosphatase PrpC